MLHFHKIALKKLRLLTIGVLWLRMTTLSYRHLELITKVYTDSTDRNTFSCVQTSWPRLGGMTIAVGSTVPRDFGVEPQKCVSCCASSTLNAPGLWAAPRSLWFKAAPGDRRQNSPEVNLQLRTSPRLFPDLMCVFSLTFTFFKRILVTYWPERCRKKVIKCIYHRFLQAKAPDWQEQASRVDFESSGPCSFWAPGEVGGWVLQEKAAEVHDCHRGAGLLPRAWTCWILSMCAGHTPPSRPHI